MSLDSLYTLKIYSPHKIVYQDKLKHAKIIYGRFYNCHARKKKSKQNKSKQTKNKKSWKGFEPITLLAAV